MHELPLLIFTLFLQGSVGVTLWLALGGAQALPRNVLLPAACCLLPGHSCWPAWGCSPRRCIWATRSMLSTRCATYPAPG